MDASNLHVVCCVANPMQWASRIRLAKAFIQHMLESGVDLTVVETVYGDHPFQLADIPGIHHIPTHAKTMVWAKESSLNVGIRSLPRTARYVAWVDADVEFRDPQWALKTLHALQFKPVVQPWSEALDLGPQGETMTVKAKEVQRSFGWVWQTTNDVLNWWKAQQAGENYSYPHGGYAWASTVDWFEQVGGLLDFSGAGAADHQMSLAMVGHVSNAIHGLSSPGYTARVKAWGERCFEVTQGHVGYVQGRIEHSFHGSKGGKHGRKYVERWDILNEFQFDPNTDLVRNRSGLVELAGNKPGLTRALQRYFSDRFEDANVRLDD